MDRKIAIPVDEAGYLNGHFGHSKWFVVLDIANSEIVFAENILAPPHEPGLLPSWLAQKGVTETIVGSIGQKAVQLLDKYGVKVHAGSPKLKAIELVKKSMDNTLILSPNKCKHS